eukprot:m.224527 g.224527  ORF g.224527 m.224527 type:complete len:132 (-) comp13852_c7_seq1:1130-1525(-)
MFCICFVLCCNVLLYHLLSHDIVFEEHFKKACLCFHMHTDIDMARELKINKRLEEANMKDHKGQSELQKNVFKVRYSMKRPPKSELGDAFDRRATERHHKPVEGANKELNDQQSEGEGQKRDFHSLINKFQ